MTDDFNPYNIVELADDVQVAIENDGYGRRADMDSSRPQYRVRFWTPEGEADFKFWGNEMSEPSAAEAARHLLSDAMSAHIAADEARVELPDPDELSVAELTPGSEYAEMWDALTDGHGEVSPSESLRLFVALTENARKLADIGIHGWASDGEARLNELDEAALAAKRED